MNAVITPEALREHLHYDPETGSIVWKHGTSDKRPAGRPAFYTKALTGYLIGSFKYRRFLAHRVAWALHYGNWPLGQIDHINGDRTDNRIANLRDVTNRENGMNMRRGKGNKSGRVGVSWDAVTRKWRASIFIEGRCINLGRYAEFEEACRVRAEAERQHGFHVNHGKEPQGRVGVL
jgi:hypothetical protein